jgi:hypothetical protein
MNSTTHLSNACRAQIGWRGNSSLHDGLPTL